MTAEPEGAVANLRVVSAPFMTSQSDDFHPFPQGQGGRFCTLAEQRTSHKFCFKTLWQEKGPLI